ncbi:MAG: ATP-dependent helicase, partial [Mycobacteriales bacterium]
MNPADLPDLLGVAFTAEQLDAITAPAEPTLVVAGAGSGKTTVTAARVVWLVGTGAARPDEVLCLTFTTKATGELSARVSTALRRAGLLPDPAADPTDPTDPTDPGEPLVATYHAYAQRLVRAHGVRIGVEPDATLLADAARFQLAARVARQARGPYPQLGLYLPSVVQDMISLDGELAEHLVLPAAVTAHGVALVAELDEVLAHLCGLPGTVTLQKDLRRVRTATLGRASLVELVVAYRAAKRAANVLDFADLVALAARLARDCPEVRLAERAAFRVVLLDEYQDTSVAQRELLTALFGAGHPVTAVGDPGQSIYGWRGASVANIEAFPEHFPTAAGSPARRWPLRVNQRSGGVLLDLANRLSKPLRDRHSSIELQPRPAAEGAGRPVVALLDTQDAEALWVADRIVAELAAHPGWRPKDAAVLVRTRREIPRLHAALSAAGLPVEVVGLGGLVTLPPVADLVAILEVVQSPTANAALVRLLTGSRWRIGGRDLHLLGRRAAELTGASTRHTHGLSDIGAGDDPTETPSLAEALEDPGPGPYSPGGRARFAALAAELRGLRRHAGAPLVDLVHRTLAATGLAVEIESSPAALAGGFRRAVASFLDIVAGFADLDGEASLAAFLAYLQASSEYDEELDTASPSGADAVALLTVHRAKGLEWDIVAVPGLVEGNFPLRRLRGRWITTQSALPGPLRGDRTAGDETGPAAWTKDGLAAYTAACRAKLFEEELRLGYVAVTRPRHVLLASGYWWGARQTPSGPSAFLEVLLEQCCEGSGEVARWVPEPGERGAPADPSSGFAWPPALDATGWRCREEAAAAVRAALAGSPQGSDAELSPEESELVAGWDSALALVLSEAAGPGRGPIEVDLPAALSTSQLLQLARDPDGFAAELVRPLPHP